MRTVQRRGAARGYILVRARIGVRPDIGRALRGNRDDIGGSRLTVGDAQLEYIVTRDVGNKRRARRIRTVQSAGVDATADRNAHDLPRERQ